MEITDDRTIDDVRPELASDRRVPYADEIAVEDPTFRYGGRAAPIDALYGRAADGGAARRQLSSPVSSRTALKRRRLPRALWSTTASAAAGSAVNRFARLTRSAAATARGRRAIRG